MGLGRQGLALLMDECVTFETARRLSDEASNCKSKRWSWRWEGKVKSSNHVCA